MKPPVWQAGLVEPRARPARAAEGHPCAIGDLVLWDSPGWLHLTAEMDEETGRDRVTLELSPEDVRWLRDRLAEYLADHELPG